MKASELFGDVIAQDFEAQKLCLDSRKCIDNSVFFAIKGSKLNGEEYIYSAIKNGAKAIVIEESSSFKIEEAENINIIRVPNMQSALAEVCEKFFTKIPKHIVAVTGTNGKTSTACFFANIISKLGKKSASIGTLGCLLDGDFDKNIDESGLTTPDIITLYETLAELKKRGVEYVCMEASSHGLEQNRIGNLKFDAAGFLNLSQDHLDYHNTMEKYFSAKKILFQNHLKTHASAILNADIDEFEELKNINDNIIEYGFNATDIRINDIVPLEGGLQITVNETPIKTALIGDFQAHNLACAIGLIKALGFSEKEILDVCNGLKSVRGRMELFKIEKQNAIAVVDYAHTPDALEKAVESVSSHVSGRLITLFGCGGDRDKSKRPLMGKVACENSDVVIITDDNPRTENADLIRAQIKASCKTAIEIGNRKEAIIRGLKMLQKGDVLLVAGKGHEDYQIIGDKKFHFSDAEIIKDYLNS